MSEHSARTPTAAELHAVITRADGTVHDLGCINATYTNPLKNAWWRLLGARLAQRRINAANAAHQKEG